MAKRKASKKIAAPVDMLENDSIWQAFAKAHPMQAREIVNESRRWEYRERHAFVQGFMSGMIGWANRPEEKV